MFVFVDVNECQSSPCKNGGTCTNKVNYYVCSCWSGYFGTNCESESILVTASCICLERMPYYFSGLAWTLNLRNVGERVSGEQD